MEIFLKFAKRESRRLRKEHNEIVDAITGKHPHAVVRRLENESCEARLILADEMERAAKIVRQAIATAKDLHENGGLS